jgi:hypothetical protein
VARCVSRPAPVAFFSYCLLACSTRAGIVLKIGRWYWPAMLDLTEAALAVRLPLARLSSE